jgi:DNA-binding MarR family transcriptional regulator
MLNTVSIEDCARAILDVTPLTMRMIRTEMRSNRSPDLTVPQFRTLIFIRDNAAASLTDVSEHLGLTLSSTSKLVDGLVKRALVERSDAPQDRRRMIIKLTASGNASLDQAIQCTLERVSAAIESLSPAQRTQIFNAMQILGQLFNPDRPQPTD